jgi:hypothetical protein
MRHTHLRQPSSARAMRSGYHDAATGRSVWEDPSPELGNRLQGIGCLANVRKIRTDDRMHSNTAPVRPYAIALASWYARNRPSSCPSVYANVIFCGKLSPSSSERESYPRQHFSNEGTKGIADHSPEISDRSTDVPSRHSTRHSLRSPVRRCERGSGLSHARRVSGRVDRAGSWNAHSSWAGSARTVGPDSAPGQSSA